MVLTDDIRYEAFEKVARFREFAREGTFFERAHVTNSMCCPYRSSALTWRYSHNHGVLSNKTRGSVRGGYGPTRTSASGLFEEIPGYVAYEIIRDGSYELVRLPF